MKCCIVIVFFCVGNSALAQKTHSLEELRILAEYTEDIGVPRPSRVRRDDGLAKESPVKVGVFGGALLNGITAVASNLPQVTKDGRHYWPSMFSLTNQIGLQGVNGLVDDVVNYERTRALAVARDASCAQRTSCRLSQNLVSVRNMFGTLSEEHKLVRNIDCDIVFAGCEHYH